ncbi:site-specific integrase [Peptostreptococcus russellii]|uniref:site-specific integrase n=1 Tax=Peptostreptococcus russellii TaxID=215200 RepID=UPI003F582B71
MNKRGDNSVNYVEPIRDVDKIHNICSYLRDSNERNYILFMLGIYTGLRISDILNLRISDVHEKDFIKIKEQKTNKQKIIMVNPILKKALAEYTADKDKDDFVIRSRETYNKSISRVRAYQILKEIGNIFGIKNLGTHSMRKTWGYHYYKQTKDIALLQKAFNHASPAITLRYIGIDQDCINKAFKSFRYY